MSDFEPFVIEGLEEFQRRLGRVGDAKQIERIASNSLRRGARHIASDTIAGERQRGVLKTVFGRNAAGLRKIVYAGKVQNVSGVLECKINVKGLAAIQETGGRTAPHVIEPSGRALAFVSHGRSVVTRQRVNHPGATHPRMSIFPSAFAAGQPLAVADFEKSFSDYIEKAWARG